MDGRSGGGSYSEMTHFTKGQKGQEVVESHVDPPPEGTWHIKK